MSSLTSIGLSAAVAAVVGAALASAGPAAAQPGAAPADSIEPASAAPAMPVHDVSADATALGVPKLPEEGGSCYVYDDYVVIAWRSPDPEPVAVVRERTEGRVDCTPDSLPGDFVIRSEWAEYFCGMWRDLLLIDSGTGNIRALIVYDVPTRRKVGILEGSGGTEGWIDDVTIRIWMLASTDAPRELCPHIPEVFGVGVDSLYALNLETLNRRALGPWRCRPLE